MATEMDKIIGKWELAEVDKDSFDVILQKMGIEDEAKRKMFRDMSYTTAYSRQGDEWTIEFSAAGFNKATKFKLGEQFDETTLDGRPIKSIVEIKNGRFEERHLDAKKPGADSLSMIKEVNGDDLIVTTTYTGLSSVSRSKRV